MGGGNLVANLLALDKAGLSPRGRGKRVRRTRRQPLRRSIPAWAGETITQYNDNYLAAVYPRVGGGNGAYDQRTGMQTGLSPRGRGKLRQPAACARIAGSIPAWAGETGLSDGTLRACQVYPRVGGGNLVFSKPERKHKGLSPRGRGKRAARPYGRRRGRSIPAWAGETTPPMTPTSACWVYPRVGGGNWRGRSFRVHFGGLSPRGRGKLPRGNGVGETRRSIPAWAGETCAGTSVVCSQEVYPRVGGGNIHDAAYPEIREGLSPRGRGKQCAAHLEELERRSIPAWAGETEIGLVAAKNREVYPRVGGGNAVHIF